MINGSAPPPPYADRICHLFVGIGYSITVLLSLVYTEDVRRVLLCLVSGERYNRRRRRQIQCMAVATVGSARANPETTE